jgi:hypothetical protein
MMPTHALRCTPYLLVCFQYIVGIISRQQSYPMAIMVIKPAGNIQGLICLLIKKMVQDKKIPACINMPGFFLLNDLANS